MIGHTATAPTTTYTKETERQVLAQPNFRHAAQVMEIIQSLSPLYTMGRSSTWRVLLSRKILQRSGWCLSRCMVVSHVEAIWVSPRGYGFGRGRYLNFQQQEHLWRTTGHSKDCTGTSEMEKMITDLQHLYIIGSTTPSTALLFVTTIPALIKPVCFQIVGFS